MKHSIVKGTQKGIIIFIHGNSSSSRIYEDILVSEEIHQTKIAVDLPGHGVAANNYQESDFTIASFCQNLQTLVNEMEEDVLLVGNSLGGHLAIEIAPFIKNLKGLVVFGAPPIKKPINFDEAFLEAPEMQIFFKEKSTDDEILKALHLALYQKEAVKVVFEDIKKTNSKLRLEMARAIVENNFEDEFKIFTQLEIPKYIISGESDPTVNPHYLKDVQKKSLGVCEIIPFKKCGHYASVEQPKLFRKTIERIAEEVF